MKSFLLRLAALMLPLLSVQPLGAQSMPVGSAEPAEALGFGRAVAALGDAVFVGEGANTMRPGAVYVYRSVEGRWSEALQLTAPDASVGDRFGTTLAAWPGVLLVSQTPSGEAGRVHVYRESGDGWEPSGVLAVDSLSPGAEFGTAVAVGDGVVAVGAPGVDDGAGRVYLFRATRDRWEGAGVLSAPDPAAGDAFGSAIDVDGTRILVGAPGSSQRAGAAVIFRQDPGTGAWLQESALAVQELQRRSGFGSSVVLAGDRALVAAPGHESATGAVVEFTFDPGEEGWSESGRLRPFDGTRFAQFGSAMVYRGGTLYVGAPGADDTGAIYTLDRGESGGWTGAGKILAMAQGFGARAGFGSSLAMAGDVAVAGATGVDHGAGAAVILSRSGGGWRSVEMVKSAPESLPALTGRELRCESGSIADTYSCSAVDLLAFLPVHAIGGARGVELNDIWGWADPETGREYALVGRIDGTSFVDVTDPQNPRYLGDLPKTEGSISAAWRDIKVYRNHAYIVADGAGQHGMQVFDLTRLRGVEEPVTFDADTRYDGVASTHNIVIDTTSGFAFAVGASGGGETCGGGLHMIDIRTAISPEFAGCFSDPRTGRASTGYTHDAQCVTYQGPDPDYGGREICLGANETALSIADVTDKESPVAVARAGYPNVGYTHQGWLTPDHRYFYMNDELDELRGLTERTRTLIWDVTDLDDPILVGELEGLTEASDHNLYIRADLMYQSNYVAGLRVVDVSDPENPRHVGHLDTAPFGANTAGFDGSWSNYPFLPSGIVVVTSMREGLFIVRVREPSS